MTADFFFLICRDCPAKNIFKFLQPITLGSSHSESSVSRLFFVLNGLFSSRNCGVIAGIEGVGGCNSILSIFMSNIKFTERNKVVLYGNATAGLAAGFCSSLIMHPLDVVTTRMQAHCYRTTLEPKYNNPFEALWKIAHKEGYSQLYAGVVPNIVGSMTNWGVYFLGYNYTRSQVRAYINRNNCLEEHELTPGMNLFCATAIGCISAILTQPLWLVKTRMELQDPERPQYKTMNHCLRSVASKEGIGALFK